MTHQRIQAEIFDPAGQRQRREKIHALVRAALRARFLDETGRLVDRLAEPQEKRCRLWVCLALLAGDDNDRCLANSILAALPLAEPCHFALLASAMLLNRHEAALHPASRANLERYLRNCVGQLMTSDFRFQGFNDNAPAGGAAALIVVGERNPGMPWIPGAHTAPDRSFLTDAGACVTVQDRHAVLVAYRLQPLLIAPAKTLKLSIIFPQHHSLVEEIWIGEQRFGAFSAAVRGFRPVFVRDGAVYLAFLPLVNGQRHPDLADIALETRTLGIRYATRNGQCVEAVPLRTTPAVDLIA